MLLVVVSQRTHAQTPSPLQEWQYSGGIALAHLFDPDPPHWRVLTGLAAETEPVYEGSRAFKVQGGPVVDIRYKDIAFASTGDGLGFNLLRGDHYQFGASMGYDMGRKERDDYTNLRGTGDIKLAPVAKVFGTVVLAKSFPLVLRVDARQFIGGAQGAVGDAGIYMPLPGSSKTLVMFAGPSVTFATHHYLQTLFGVTPQQSLSSGHPVYEDIHGGTSALGFGFSATKFLTSHWLVNLNSAIGEIKGRAADSPLVESRTQRALVLSFEYQW